jgi:MerR family transcriptional regulator, copper efflux regulator
MMYNVTREKKNKGANMSRPKREKAEDAGILKDYMTIAEAADYVGVSPMTLRRWDKAGKLHAKRHPMNRYRLYKKSDLDNLKEMIEENA